jgi:8-oxo-dGTP diphosphatase
MRSGPLASTRVAVDLVVLTVRDDAFQILLVERANDPFKGRWALPGGFLQEGEDLLETADRELREETGLTGVDLWQVKAYGHPDRDPRGHIVTISFLAVAPRLPSPNAGTDAANAIWQPVMNLSSGQSKASPPSETVGLSPGPKSHDAVSSVMLELAFDHYTIAADAIEYARGKLEQTNIATAFCPPEFTIGDLRHVYELVWGYTLDERNFSRKVLKTENFLEETGGYRGGQPGRPAKLYRKGCATKLRPAMLRIAEEQGHAA